MFGRTQFSFYKAQNVLVSDANLNQHYTTSRQRYPSVAVLGNGNTVVIYESDDQDGDDYGVFGTIIDMDVSGSTPGDNGSDSGNNSGDDSNSDGSPTYFKDFDSFFCFRFFQNTHHTHSLLVSPLRAFFHINFLNSKPFIIEFAYCIDSGIVQAFL